MKILSSYESAFKIGKECLDARIKNEKPSITDGMKTLPSEVKGPWKMDEETLANTLKYIFNRLNHPAYMLCVTNEVPVIYKLDKKITPPGYQKTILKSLKNKKVKSKNKTWRLMQCVLRPHKEEYTFAKEWDKFLEQLTYKLPNGVFMLSLTDAMILRKDFHDPWPMVSGDKKLEDEYIFSSYIPLLAYSGKVGYWDIPIVNYDDLLYAIGTKTQPEFNIDWDSKKPVAVFRGSSTGCGYTAETNMRLKLSTMRSDELDVGISQYVSTLKFDPKNGLGSQDRKKFPLVPGIPMDQQSNYKYIIHVDGNVAAYRLLTTMLTGSLILKVKGDYTLWVDHILKPEKHYIEIASDLSDLEEKLKWCKEHDSECKKIAKRSLAFAKKALTKEYINASFAKVLWKLV